MTPLERLQAEAEALGRGEEARRRLLAWALRAGPRELAEHWEALEDFARRACREAGLSWEAFLGLVGAGAPLEAVEAASEALALAVLAWRATQAGDPASLALARAALLEGVSEGLTAQGGSEEEAPQGGAG